MRASTDVLQPVWHRSAVPAPEAPPLGADARCRIAVIGAGYTGLGAALQLAGEGVRPLVLEAGGIGEGASGRNGGQVVPGLKHDPETLAQIGGDSLLDFAAGAADRTFALIRDHALDCDAAQCGWLQPAATAAQLALVQRRAGEWGRHGVAVRLLDREAVRRATGSDSYAGGWIDPRGGRLQPLSYVRELARAAMAKGARVHARSPVESLTRRDGRWMLRVNGREVSAEAVVLAAGAYDRRLVPGLARSVVPSQSVQIATDPLAPGLRAEILPAGLPVSDSRRLLKYFRLDRDGRFLIGGRGSFGDGDSGRHVEGLRRWAERLYPQLRGVPWPHRWSGRIVLTLDHLPHLHCPEEGLYAALGYNGRGVAMATQVGALMARLCLGLPWRESPLPVSGVRPIPFHALRRPALEAAVVWYRLRDRLEGRAASPPRPSISHQGVSP